MNAFYKDKEFLVKLFTLITALFTILKVGIDPELLDTVLKIAAMVSSIWGMASQMGSGSPKVGMGVFGDSNE